jgi:transcription antitermination factor NusG
MPILPREPDIFPESLFDTDEPPGETDAKWWVVYTLPRREKQLMRHLFRMEIPFYCPLVKRRTRSASGRVRVSHVALFPGYVFLRATEAQRYQTWTTNCVSRCLEVPNYEELVRDLRQIRHLVSTDAPLTPEARIEAGMRIRVRSGPFVGLEGTVIKRRGVRRLLVVVQFLQQGASVQLEDYQVEQIG